MLPHPIKPIKPMIKNKTLLRAGNFSINALFPYAQQNG